MSFHNEEQVTLNGSRGTDERKRAVALVTRVDWQLSKAKFFFFSSIARMETRNLSEQEVQNVKFIQLSINYSLMLQATR